MRSDSRFASGANIANADVSDVRQVSYRVGQKTASCCKPLEYVHEPYIAKKLKSLGFGLHFLQNTIQNHVVRSEKDMQ